MALTQKKSIVLYEIDFNKLDPYIRKLDSDKFYFVVAWGNPDFAISVLDPVEEETKKGRYNPSVPGEPEPPDIEEPVPEEPPEPKIPESVTGPLRQLQPGEIQIRTAAELAKIGQDPNYPLNVKYPRMVNIDLSGYDWEPIGEYTVNFGDVFAGTYDGNGFVIKNLRIMQPRRSYAGLFSLIRSPAKLINISLKNVNVQGDKYVGGLVGNNRGGTIINCNSSGTVSGGKECIGGLVGAYSGDSKLIRNSYTSRTVSGKDWVGGLAGSAGAPIINCYSTANVVGEKYVGGLIGKTENTVTYCYSTGSVTGDYAVGGLVGRNIRGTIRYCYTTRSYVVYFNDQGVIENCRSSLSTVKASSISIKEADV